MSKLIANVEHLERIMTKAKLKNEGIEITFADGCDGLIPFSSIPEIGDPSNIVNIEFPNLYQINIHISNGNLIELPWDFVRHYCDVTYQPKVEAIAFRGKQTLGKTIRKMRENAHITQAELAKEAGIGRITEIRIEKGEQSPRYQTLVAIAKALKHSIADIVADVSTIDTEQKKEMDSFNKVVSYSLETKNENEPILKAKAITEQALHSAMNNDWKTSLRLLKEAEVIVPSEHRNDISFETKVVWLCIQKTTIGPLIEKAENSLLMWDYKRAAEILGWILSILDIGKFPLDYEDYSYRVINIASNACDFADRWKNDYGEKIGRALTGLVAVKAKTEEIIEKIEEKNTARF